MAHTAGTTRKDGWPKQALARGALTEALLRAAEAEAVATKRELAEVLVRNGTLTEEQIAQCTAEAAGLVYLDVRDYQIDPKALALVPEPVARRHTLLPLYRIGNTLTVATADPWDAVAIDAVRLGARLPIIQSVVASRQAIRQALERHYGHQVVEDAAATSPSGAKAASPRAASESPAAAEVPVAKLVEALLYEAIEARASDIHLEPEEERLRVRYRIDGVLHEVKTLPSTLQDALSSRIKLLAKLDITEHRLPQDGHAPFAATGGRAIDLRISTYPTVGGENVVIRLLDHAAVCLSLEQLGVAPERLTQLVELIQRPHGLLLVTGPTGSGKTTTLYAALAHINSVEKNIMTIEDPVEYRFSLIRQTQLNPKAGVTFATGLRSILRQDPDVIMVGEIRDHETAEVAIHAALTGHLVLSTLHTNDAVSAVARLLDMGVEPYLLASTLLGVVGQRLVRKICPSCQEGSRPSAQVRARHPHLAVVYRGRGCRACRDTGFLGRLGVFELFRVEEANRGLIAGKRPSEELARQALAEGLCTMRADGLKKVEQGLTTLEEVDRVVPV